MGEHHLVIPLQKTAGQQQWGNIDQRSFFRSFSLIGSIFGAGGSKHGTEPQHTETKSGGLWCV